jgi:sugar lactone lactonase YvrE
MISCGEMGSPTARQRAIRTAAAILLLVASGVLLILLYDWWIHRLPPTPAGWAAMAETMAGDGAPGFRDGTGSTARFADPFGLVVDALGRVYVSDAGENNRIRRIDPDGAVTTIAGGEEGFADGLGSAAAFHTPSGLAIDASGHLYVADTGNHAIRRITPEGHVTTIAGDGEPGDRDGPGHSARFNGPVGIAVTTDGTIMVADTYNDRIRRITPGGQVTTVAGGPGPGYRDGPAGDALFDTPCAVASTPSGDLVVADTGNGVLRAIDAEGRVRTLDSAAPFGTPLTPVSAPISLAVTHDGFIYVAGHRDGRIVQITPDGETHRIAGRGLGFADGEAQHAQFRTPAGLAVDRQGRLYVADAGNYLVRILRPADRPDPIALHAAPFEDALLPRLAPTLFAAEAFPWPLDPQTWPHEVVGTMGEVRGTGSDRRARLHGGVDIHAPMGTLVRAVHEEKVRSPLAPWGFGGDSEGLAVDLVSYVHIKVGRTSRDVPLEDAPFLSMVDEEGRTTRVRLRRGERFRVGDPIGTINRLFHVHLEIGPPGAQMNPLKLPFIDLDDTTPPTIVRDGIRLFDEAGQRLTERRRGRFIVRGNVRIVLEAFDQVDGNLPRRRLGLYRAGYQILKTDKTPAPGFEAPRVTIEFNRLPSESDAAPMVYAEESGIAAHGNPRTRFLYILTNTLRDGRVEAGAWDSGALPPGDYILRVLAADYHGNEAVRGRDLPITIEPDDPDILTQG